MLDRVLKGEQKNRLGLFKLTVQKVKCLRSQGYSFEPLHRVKREAKEGICQSGLQLLDQWTSGIDMEVCQYIDTYSSFQTESREGQTLWLRTPTGSLLQGCCCKRLLHGPPGSRKKHHWNIRRINRAQAWQTGGAFKD